MISNVLGPHLRYSTCRTGVWCTTDRDSFSPCDVFIFAVQSTREYPCVTIPWICNHCQWHAVSGPKRSTSHSSKTLPVPTTLQSNDGFCHSPAIPLVFHHRRRGVRGSPSLRTSRLLDRLLNVNTFSGSNIPFALLPHPPYLRRNPATHAARHQ